MYKIFGHIIELQFIFYFAFYFDEKDLYFTSSDEKKNGAKYTDVIRGSNN